MSIMVAVVQKPPVLLNLPATLRNAVNDLERAAASGAELVREKGVLIASLVRYLPGSSFPEHGHPGGEEIFVIEGTFSDHLGDAHAGTHLLTPEGFRHAPHSGPGLSRSSSPSGDCSGLRPA